ncbi:hypothetical protein N7533_011287 [Penicillium manginii]|uniref:uncharacterized protein n=1 Tax=Penicillium manginii TaxID=203109 RepID=UPI0025479FBA|nr:uncharacterized protein N7533_011287 [Penicillium manginii]KAJ5741878.1 hypothetical protein N7533_011287 [Penicillium manginii]
MACTLTLNLRHFVPDMEIPSHRSHKAWLASLALLRGFALGRAQEKKNYEVFPNEQGYLGVDKDRLDQAIYIFQKLELVYRSNYDNADPKCLEFLRVHWKEPQSSVGRRTILPLLSHFMPGCSDDGLSVVPVSKCSLTLHDAGRTSIYCIEWKSFEYRDAVLSNRKWRRMLQGDSAQEEWKLILQEWGKADEEISPEEELLLFSSRMEQKVPTAGLSKLRLWMVVISVGVETRCSRDQDRVSLCSVYPRHALSSPGIVSSFMARP